MGCAGSVNPSAVHNFGKGWKSFSRANYFVVGAVWQERFLAALGMTGGAAFADGDQLCGRGRRPLGKTVDAEDFAEGFEK
jgi:hypothetical protein